MGLICGRGTKSCRLCGVARKKTNNKKKKKGGYWGWGQRSGKDAPANVEDSSDWGQHLPNPDIQTVALHSPTSVYLCGYVLPPKSADGLQ